MTANKRIRRTARQLFRFCLVHDLLDERRVRVVAHRLAASRRRGALAMLASFRRLVRLSLDQHLALVESATPLDAPAEESVRSGLVRIYGPGLHASFNQNPALIGGMRIKVGSDVYDDSVRARLATLAARL